MGGLLDRYPRGPAYDEMFGADGLPHPHTRALYDALQTLTGEDLARRAEARDRSFRDQGVVFSHAGEEWVFPLDLIPRLIPAAEWELVEAGVVQRVRALEAFLADVYGPGEVVRDKVVPRSLLTTSAGFCRRTASSRRTACGSTSQGSISSATRQGSCGYSRTTCKCRPACPTWWRTAGPWPASSPACSWSRKYGRSPSYPGWLLDALRRSAPVGAEEPVVVLLTPGVGNAAYFEHAFLARKMGIELVEGRDLFCRDNVLYMRSVGGQRRVDVLYRRVNDDFLDPVQFRADSVVGCPGILNAARAGNVTIANAVGNGVADDKLTYTYLPALIEYYLGERPLLPNVTTYRLDDPDVRSQCLARLDQLVVKPVQGSGGHGIVVGPQASDAELAAVREQVLAEPRGWIAQELVLLSTSPAQLGDQLLPRHVDLRPFAVNDGAQVRVLPGGLTRVALREGSLIVNSSQGGGSKDTWVLTSSPGCDAEADGASAFPPQAVRGAEPDRGPHQDQQQ